MSDNFDVALEAELRDRKIPFVRDVTTDLYRIRNPEKTIISTENMRRDFALNPKRETIAHYLDVLLHLSHEFPAWDEASTNIFWGLVPHMLPTPPIYQAITRKMLSIPWLHMGHSRRFVDWQMLKDWGVTKQQARRAADVNLARWADEVEIETTTFNDITAAFVTSKRQHKTSLLLASNLREKLAPFVDWPVFAVAPDYDFMYFWSARTAVIPSKLMRIVVECYAEEPYPLTTELLVISDSGVKALGTCTADGYVAY